MKVKLKTLSQSFRESLPQLKVAAIAAMPVEVLSQLIKNGAIPPYSSDPKALSAFEKTLLAGNFDAVHYVTQHCTATKADRRKFYELFTKKNPQGRSLLTALRSAKPHAPETNLTSYLVTQFNINQYKAGDNTKRKTQFNAYKELIATFTALGLPDEEALIGLLLLTTKNISNEYRLFSPRKGLLFGSRFYSNLENTLKELGVNLKTINRQETQRYYSALARFMDNNPNLIANEFILNSLSKEANITLPKIPPLLSSRNACELLQSRRRNKADKTVIFTDSGLYKTHAVPLGQGVWGTVYAARHYSNNENGLKTSPPLAIKMMSAGSHLSLNKEAELFKKVHPEGYFERFNENGKAYLAMPLFSGVPLDDYLNGNLELNQETRQKMANSLLNDLEKIHAANITHNDLKPKNMLYDPILKKIHIIDFGCAEKIGTELKYKSFNTSIFAFEMPPEYMVGAGASPKMDILSLAPIIAEILGANKKAFTEARMERALSKINNSNLTQTIRQAFRESASLEIALFSEKVYKLTETEDFNSFVKQYVNEKYDFSPYKAILGEDAIELLTSMQHSNPDERPTIEEALEILNRKETKITRGFLP